LLLRVLLRCWTQHQRCWQDSLPGTAAGWRANHLLDSVGPALNKIFAMYLPAQALCTIFAMAWLQHSSLQMEARGRSSLLRNVLLSNTSHPSRHADAS
jgi:hypothetical protein